MVDILLAVSIAAIAMFTAYLGAYLSLHPADSTHTQRRYKLAFIASGVITVVLVGWQAIRNGAAQNDSARKILALTEKTEILQHDINTARAEAQKENNRRQKAENELTASVVASGRSTRNGVVEDIKKSPIHVEISPQAQPSPMPSDAEKAILSRSLSANPPSTVMIVSAGDTVAGEIAETLAGIFRDSKWSVQRKAIGSLRTSVISNGAVGRVELEGIYLVSPDPSSQSTKTLISAFEQARHPVSSSGALSPMGDLTLYIIYGNR